MISSRTELDDKADDGEARSSCNEDGEGAVKEQISRSRSLPDLHSLIRQETGV